jgi:hypothetical protein
MDFRITALNLSRNVLCGWEQKKKKAERKVERKVARQAEKDRQRKTGRERQAERKVARQAEKGGISAFNGQAHVHHDVPSGEFQQRGRATQRDQTIVVAGGQQRQQWSHDRGLASPHDLALEVLEG